MSQIFLCRSVPLLLVVQLTLAVHCYGGVLYTARRGRSADYDSTYSSIGQQQEPSMSLSALNERMRGIFALPDQADINWINTTSEHHHTTAQTAEALGDLCEERKLGKTYCVHVPSYEEKTLLHKVSKDELEQFRELFVEDVVEPDDVKMRMRGEDPEDIELCRSKSKVIYPRRGLTRSGEWKFLYQTPKARQGVLEETCENENKPCEFSDNFPSGYVSRCKQYQSYRLMVAVENGKLSRKEFIVGGACKCVLRVKT